MIAGLEELAPSAEACTLRLRLPRQTPDVDTDRIERGVREILLAIGEDPDRDGLAETPGRVARAYREIFAGLRQNAATHLNRTFAHEGEGVVVVRGIPFFSVCEHHLLPFFGEAHVAYLPAGGRVVGLSKLARTFEVGLAWRLFASARRRA